MATPTTLPATFVAGDILTAAQQNALRGAFRVLQVVSATTSTTVSNSTTTNADTTLTATITPQSNTSKILVLVNQNGGEKSSANALNGLGLNLFRGATDIQLIAQAAGYTGSAVVNRPGTLSSAYLDSPATTSATTYKTMFRNNFASAASSVQVGSEVSTITLMEISA
jgi:hypothetical protein